MDDDEPTHTRSGRLVKRKYLHEDLVTPEFALRLHESGNSMPSHTWQRPSHRGNVLTPAGSVNRHETDSPDAGDPDDFDEDAESDTDPDALYCFCRQPYNKRFMIACDHCNEWYHGACVGVTKQQGRQMEKLCQKWLCENCGGQKPARLFKATYNENAGDLVDPNSQTPKSITSNTLPIAEASRSPPDNKQFRRADSTRSVDSSSATSRTSELSSITAARNRQSSLSSKKQSVEKPALQSPKRKSRMHRRCIKCNKINPPQSIYCGQSCILQHAMDALDLLERYIKRRHAIAVENGTDAADIPSFTHVHVVEPHSGIELNGIDDDGAPRMSELKGWLITHPTFTIRLPRDILEVTNAHHRPSSSGTAHAADRQNPTATGSSTHSLADSSDSKSSSTSNGRKASDSGSSKSHHHHHHHGSSRKSSAKEDDEAGADDDNKVDPVRQNVRQSLAEALTARWTEVKDAKENADVAVSSQSIAFIARRIERRLFKTFGDAGQKYKGKYRTILLNIKDKRNETFFQAILTGDVSPRQIVLLNSEDMASSELKKWREEEARNYLELQKKGAADIAQMKILKKTHKGDLELVAVNDERAMREDKLPDYVPPEEPDEEDDDENAAKVAATNDLTSSDADTVPANSNNDEMENITSRRVHMGSEVIPNVNDTGADIAVQTESAAAAAETLKNDAAGTLENDKDTSWSTAAEGSASKKRKASHRTHDTTAEHATHAFDSNCKICTGQISETGNTQPTSRATFVRIGGDSTTTHSPGDADDYEYDDDEAKGGDIDSQLVIAAEDDAVFSPARPSVSPPSPKTAAAVSGSEAVRSSGSSSSVADEAYDPASAGRLKSHTKQARVGSSSGVTDNKPATFVKHSSPLSKPALATSAASGLIWSGSIHYHEVGSVDLCGQVLFGHQEFMRLCLRSLSTLQVIGRIGSSDVYQHFQQIKRLKEHGFILLTLPTGTPASAASIYQAFVKWFCAKDRLAVIENSSLTKDIYMIPVDAKGGAGSTSPAVLASLIGAAGMQRIDTMTKSITGGALILLVVSRTPYGQAANAVATLTVTKPVEAAHRKHHHKPASASKSAQLSSSSSTDLLTSTLNPGGESEFAFENHALSAADKAAKNDAEYDPSAEMEIDEGSITEQSKPSFDMPPLLPELNALSARIAHQKNATALTINVTATVKKSHDDDEEYSPGNSDNEDAEMTDLSGKAISFVGSRNADDDDTLPDLALPKLPPPPPQPPTFVVSSGSSGEAPRDPRARAAAHLQQQPKAEHQHQALLFSNPSLAGIDIDAVIGQLLGCQTPGEMTEIFKSLPSAEARRLLVEEMNRRVKSNQEPQQSEAYEPPRPHRIIPPAMRVESNHDSALLSIPGGGDTKMPLLPDPNRLTGTSPVVIPCNYAVPPSNTASVAQLPVLPYGERRRPPFSGESSFETGRRVKHGDDDAVADRKPRQRIGPDGVALSRYGVPVTRVVDAKIKASQDKLKTGGTSKRDSDKDGTSKRGDNRDHRDSGKRSTERNASGDTPIKGENDIMRGSHDSSVESRPHVEAVIGEKRTTSSEKQEETAIPLRSSVKLEIGANGEKRLPMGRIPRLQPREPKTIKDEK